MAKANTKTTGGMKGMHGKSDRKARGRTNIAQPGTQSPTRPNVPQNIRTEASRPISSGGGKHRGDRRDTSRLYTNNAKHPSRGNNARPDVKTRKR